MKKKSLSLLIAFLISILALSACGNGKEISKEDDSTKKDTPEAEVEKEDDKEVDKEDVEEPEEDNNKEATQSSNDFAEILSYMEKETEGTTKVLYENTEQQVHKMEDVSVSLDGYTFVELNDFHTDYEIPFRNQTDGVVIVAQYTVTNDSDKDLFYMPFLSMTISHDGRERAHSNNNALTPREEQLITKLGPTNDYLLKAGESISGYEAYSFGKTELDTLMNLSVLDMVVPRPQTDKDDYGSTIGEEGRFRIALSDDGAETASNNSKFYEDKVTFDNMGEKKMIKEKSDIGESQDLADATVTLEGYQFTEFTPNADEAPRFENFTNGMVLLTTKFSVKNNGSENIDLYGLNAKLTVNDGAQYQLNEGMLLKMGIKQIVEPGKEDEFLQIFVLDQEQYEKIWKEKAFEIEVGPFKNEESKDISKGKRVTFTLPN